MAAKKQIHFRRLNPRGKGSSHFLAALQLIAHVVTPIRKGLIHFYLQNKSEYIEKEEWILLRELGLVFQALISAPTNAFASGDDEDDEEPSEPVNATAFYEALEPCMSKFQIPEPRDATQAVNILLDMIQKCTKTLPVTGELWSSMLDSAVLGLVARQTITGKTKLEDGQMLQRTKKESLILACPYVIPKFGEPKESITLEEVVKDWCSKQKHVYDFDEKPFDFEVKIPLLLGFNDTSGDDWTTTRTLQFKTLNGFLFLGLTRLEENGKVIETEIKFPKILDISKLCADSVKGGKKYELCAGVLYDEEDYVAVVKNAAITNPEEDGAWQLMEVEEIIPMAESDILEFLKGEGEDSPCGTLAIYRQTDESVHQDMNRLLSDIIMSHVSGVLSAENDFYYEEEVIEE